MFTDRKNEKKHTADADNDVVFLLFMVHLSIFVNV